MPNKLDVTQTTDRGTTKLADTFARALQNHSTQYGCVFDRKPF